MGIEKLHEFWPEWEIGDILGKGSFGRVYKASNRGSGVTSLSAIKVITIPNDEAEYDALLNEGMSVSDTKEYFRDIVNEFINEIKVMVALKGAPNIVAVEDYKILESKERVGWDIFIRMELLHSFKEFLNSHTPTESEIVKMGIDIANALEICQQKNIIHRDIKPANIFMDDYGSFKLGDFGIAKELEKTTGAASSKGTFTFMAPEVAHGQRYDNTVDIYSLGLVMYTILSGNRAPFVPANGRVTYNDRKAANDRRLAGEPLPRIEGVSDELNNIILTACAYDPAKRFRNATAFKNALKSVKPSLKAPKDLEEKVKPSYELLDRTKPEPKQEKSVPNQKKVDPKQEFDQTVTVAHKPQTIPESPKTEAPSEKPKKKKKGIIIAVAILLVLAIAAAVIIPALVHRSDKPAGEEIVAAFIKSENYSITPEMFTYWYFSDLYNFNENYGAMAAYLAPSQTAPVMTTSLATQYYDNGVESGTAQTWHEYFLNQTLGNVQGYLCYAEEALAVNFKYDNLEKDIDAYIESMKKDAAAQNLDFDTFLKNFYGSSVKESDIREVLVIQLLASKYLESVRTEKKSRISESELEAYRIENDIQKDNSHTKTVHHILITKDKYGSDEKAEAKAKEVLEEYNNGEKGVKTFESIAKKYNEDSTSFYENVAEGIMVEEFNDWLFDESRKEGDTDIVKTEYGYHVMYFDGDGIVKWKADALNGLIYEIMETYQTELQDKYKDSIEIDDNLLSKVPDRLPETAFPSDDQDTDDGGIEVTPSVEHDHDGDVVPDYSADTHQYNGPAPKVNKVVNANEMAMYNAIFYDKDESYINTDMTKTGIFTIVYDAFNGRERYYVWGYDDDSADSSWQWEFTVADPSTLPKVGSEVTVTGKFVANNDALDKKWIENAAVIVVSEYNNALCKYDLTTMGPIMSGRVQIPNIQSNLDEFNDKIALYAKVAEHGMLSSVYEDIPWIIHTIDGIDLPDVGTIVTVVGTFDEHGLFMIETLYIEE